MRTAICAIGDEASRENRLQARSGGRCSQAISHYACNAAIRRTLHQESRRRLTHELDSAYGVTRRPCRDVGWSIPQRSLHHEFRLRACVTNIGRTVPRSPIMRRLMPTAKTTMLPANNARCQKVLATTAIRRRPLHSCAAWKRTCRFVDITDIPRDFRLGASRRAETAIFARSL